MRPPSISGWAMSPFTFLGLRKFQQDRGLAADGIVGPKTWAALLQAAEDTANQAGNSAGETPQPNPTLANATSANATSEKMPLYTVTIPHLTAQQARELLAAYAGGRMTEE